MYGISPANFLEKKKTPSLIWLCLWPFNLAPYLLKDGIQLKPEPKRKRKEKALSRFVGNLLKAIDCFSIENISFPYCVTSTP